MKTSVIRQHMPKETQPISQPGAPEQKFSNESTSHSRELSYKDPLEIVRRTHGRSSWQTEREHFRRRMLYRDDSGATESGLAFDRSWDCERCRPFLVEPWRDRILEAAWDVT